MKKKAYIEKRERKPKKNRAEDNLKQKQRERNETVFERAEIE